MTSTLSRLDLTQDGIARTRNRVDSVREEFSGGTVVLVEGERGSKLFHVIQDAAWSRKSPAPAPTTTDVEPAIVDQRTLSEAALQPGRTNQR